MILGPLPGQTLRLLDLRDQRRLLSKNQEKAPPFLLSLPGADLKGLVLPAELLHGCRRVVQLPPELDHFGLQSLYLAFTLHTPHTQTLL